jgi:hypothetical protein
MSNGSSSDLENGHEENKKVTPPRTKLSHWRIIYDRGAITPEIESWHYQGAGTEEDPFQVAWIENDPRNPMEFPAPYRWMLVLAMALSVLGVSLNSSMFSGGI